MMEILNWVSENPILTVVLIVVIGSALTGMFKAMNHIHCDCVHDEDD